MPEKIKLNILGLSDSQTQENAYVLILTEEDGKHRIPIIIGSTEAQAIAIQLENWKAPRPLTHDLFYNFGCAFGITIREVLIYKLEEGIFYSRIICQKDDQIVDIDSRTSDAVALATRFGCPIYTTPEIVEKVGISYESNNTQSTSQKQKDLCNYSKKELNDLLSKAIEEEDYEKASKIRDELQRRNDSL